MSEPILWITVAVLTAYFVYVFNRLVAARNACVNARAGIDVNLSRRHDLIPNLVLTVKAYAHHERTTLNEVTRARSQAIDALGTPGSANAEAVLEQSLGNLVARVEAYPELRADQPFMQLMRNLTEAEEQISASRRAFNAQVMAMNNLVQQFPTLIVARLTGFVALVSYRADVSAFDAPLVKLEVS